MTPLDRPSLDAAATGEAVVPSPDHHRLRLRTYEVEVVNGDVVTAG